MCFIDMQASISLTCSHFTKVMFVLPLGHAATPQLHSVTVFAVDPVFTALFTVDPLHHLIQCHQKPRFLVNSLCCFPVSV